MLNEKGIDFSSVDQHFNCFPHVLNLGVQDMFKTLKVDNVDVTADEDRDSLKSEDQSDDEDCRKTEITAPLIKLRKLCKKLKKSEKLKIKLGHHCQLCDEALVDLPIDVCTRWNSSYDLITPGLRMKKALSALASTEKKLKHLVINEEEWAILSLLQENLRGFKQLSVSLSGANYATLPLVVVGVNVLLDNIEKSCHQLDHKDERTAADKMMIKALQAARDKMLKHYLKTNWVYGAVLILDPRHKLEVFDKTLWGKDLKEASYKKFESIFKTKYADRKETPKPLETVEESDDDDEYLKNLRSLYEIDNDGIESWTEELECYLRMARSDFNVDMLKWWRENECTFPCLSKMARDLLASTGSAVPSERFFTKAGLLLRKHRNRLSDEHIEMSLCMNSWFLSELVQEISDAMMKVS